MAGDRGQTPQDFALGVGIFLFAVAFAFSVLPGLATPFETDVGGDEAVRANQVADTAVAHLTLADETPRLNATRTVTFFRFHPVSSDLRRFFGLASTAGVNVTVRNESGIVRLTDATGTPVRLAAGGDPPADRRPHRSVWSRPRQDLPATPSAGSRSTSGDPNARRTRGRTRLGTEQSSAPTTTQRVAMA